MKIHSRRPPTRLSTRAGGELRWMTLAIGGPASAAPRAVSREATPEPAEDDAEGGLPGAEEGSAPA